MKRTRTMLAATAGAALALSLAGSAGAALPGAALFTKASCGACHTLKAAKAKGAVGPNLDKAKPSSALLIKQITNGGGGMPPFKASFTAAQIKQIAAYVVSVAGK